MDRNLHTIALEADTLWERLGVLNREALDLLGLGPDTPVSVLAEAVVKDLTYIGLTPAREQAYKWLVSQQVAQLPRQSNRGRFEPKR